MALYLAVGMLGIGWFSQGRSGWEFASFGYILGFVVAAFLVGKLAERGTDRSPLKTAGVMALGNLVIYAVGVPFLMSFAQMGLGRALAARRAAVPDRRRDQDRHRRRTAARPPGSSSTPSRSEVRRRDPRRGWRRARRRSYRPISRRSSRGRTRSVVALVNGHRVPLPGRPVRREVLPRVTQGSAPDGRLPTPAIRWRSSSARSPSPNRRPSPSRPSRMS